MPDLLISSTIDMRGINVGDSAVGLFLHPCVSERLSTTWIVRNTGGINVSERHNATWIVRKYRWDQCIRETQHNMDSKKIQVGSMYQRDTIQHG